MAKSKSATANLAVLFTCIGRRVSLLNSFRLAAKQLKINASFYGTDTTELETNRNSPQPAAASSSRVPMLSISVRTKGKPIIS
jgi:hypothetical protein